MGTFSNLYSYCPFCKPIWPPQNICFSLTSIVNTSEQFLLLGGNTDDNPQNCFKIHNNQL